LFGKVSLTIVRANGTPLPPTPSFFPDQNSRTAIGLTWFAGRYELLLLSLSSHILRQTLPNRYPSSTRLALSPPPTKPYDIDLLRTHNLLHTYTLSHLARQRQKARVQACSFSRLLHEKATDLAAREKRSTHTLDFKTVVSSCDAELARWERHWTNIRNDWVLESLKKALSPEPPTEFFSLSYEKAFARNTALEEKRPIQTTITSATGQSESNIANLIAAEHSLKDEITALEASNSIASTPSRASTPDLRRTSLRGRKSLPPTPVKTPSPNRGAQLQFKRSTSRLSVQEMDFIAGERKTMNDEHRKVANLNVV